MTVYQPAVAELGIDGGPCYRCLYPDPPPPGEVPSCSEAGVLGVLPGIIGSIQALETIKVILGLGEPLIGRILSVDTTEMEFRVFNLRKDPTNEVTYDNRDRVETVDNLGTPGVPTVVLTYTYDDVSNVLTVTDTIDSDPGAA